MIKVSALLGDQRKDGTMSMNVIAIRQQAVARVTARKHPPETGSNTLPNGAVFEWETHAANAIRPAATLDEWADDAIAYSPHKDGPVGSLLFGIMEAARESPAAAASAVRAARELAPDEQYAAYRTLAGLRSTMIPGARQVMSAVAGRVVPAGPARGGSRHRAPEAACGNPRPSGPAVPRRPAPRPRRSRVTPGSRQAVGVTGAEFAAFAMEQADKRNEMRGARLFHPEQYAMADKMFTEAIEAAFAAAVAGAKGKVA